MIEEGMARLDTTSWFPGLFASPWDLTQLLLLVLHNNLYCKLI